MNSVKLMPAIQAQVRIVVVREAVDLAAPSAAENRLPTLEVLLVAEGPEEADNPNASYIAQRSQHERVQRAPVAVVQRGTALAEELADSTVATYTGTETDPEEWDLEALENAVPGKCRISGWCGSRLTTPNVW